MQPNDPNVSATQSPDAASLGQQAYNASNQAADLQTSAPSMLNQLKQNLVGVFAKDNPIMSARSDALSGYLSAASQSRANMLPSNMPTVEGRQLALSPTQQDAITQSYMNSKLAPLMGYNNIIAGMGGNINDILSNAGNIYSSAIQGAGNRANTMMDLYKQAVSNEQFNKNYQLELQRLGIEWMQNQPLWNLIQNAGSLGGLDMNGNPGAGMDNRPSLDSFNQPDQQNSIPLAQQLGNGIQSLGSTLQHGLQNAGNWFEGLYNNVPQAGSNNPVAQFLRKYNI